ncbi:MAG: NAD(P)/FAD-dependent oxidoreductase [Bacteroidia bacterium]
MAEERICIAGAGLVGSLWSLFLAKHGYAVDVLERRPDMRKTGAAAGRSINLALSDRGWKALESVGIRDEIMKIAIPMHGRMIHAEDGTLNLLPYGRAGQAIYSVSRGGLNEKMMTIAEASEKVKIYFEEKVDALDLETGIVQSEGGKQRQYKLIFGADGAFSQVRLNMMLQSERFNYSQQFLPHGYKELTIPPGKDGRWQMEKNALHIWPRKHFMLIALPNMDGSYTVTLFLTFEGDESFASLQNAQAVQLFFEQYFPDATELMPELARDFFSNPTGSLVTVSCAPWHYKDKTCLMGDAAHAIVPFYGQGMNAGFEDCTVLEQLMLQHGDNWTNILADFSLKRKTDGDAIAELALRNFIEMRDLVADPHFLRKREISRRIQQLYPEHWIPAYGLVTFSNIPYSKALFLSDQQNKVLETLSVRNEWEEYIKSETMKDVVQGISEMRDGKSGKSGSGIQPVI